MGVSIEQFHDHGGRLRTDDLDSDAFRCAPLHPDVLRCLGYMHDIESRFAGHYASAARQLLKDKRRAQRVTSWFLRLQWAPVGNGDVPHIETSFATALLFSSPSGRAMVDRVEERIDAFPGLARLNLVRSALDIARAHVVAREGFVPDA